MSADRTRYGLLLSAFGAMALAISVFLPWYGVSLTAQGTAAVARVGDQVAAQFGNAALQSEAASMQGRLGALAGRQLVTLSAHQALRDISVLLLILAGLALLDALVPLARSTSPLPDGAGASVVLLGAVAALLVGFRMLVPPTPEGGLFALSLRGGAWLALVGSLTMLAAGLWPRVGSVRGEPEQLPSQSMWSSLSGWTPES